MDDHLALEEAQEMVGLFSHLHAYLHGSTTVLVIQLCSLQCSGGVLILGGLTAQPEVNDVLLSVVILVGVEEHVAVASIELAVHIFRDRGEIEILDTPDLELAASIIYWLLFNDNWALKQVANIHALVFYLRHVAARLDGEIGRRKGPLEACLEVHGFVSFLDIRDVGRGSETLLLYKVRGHLPGFSLLCSRSTASHPHK
mmetsp:Transcript_33552/g.85883  ORF Transcript_33552/g.85883 Transcript_33552/m.85883 type:complete len:200 (-) Transcript_33552:890-1489(-)